MSEVGTSDVERMTNEVDDIDTNFVMNEKLSFDEVERLNDIIRRLQPYFGDPKALNVAYTAFKLLKKAGRVEEKPVSNIDTTVCQLCGQEFTGTNEEIVEWEPIHLQQAHPEYLAEKVNRTGKTL